MLSKSGCRVCFHFCFFRLPEKCLYACVSLKVGKGGFTVKQICSKCQCLWMFVTMNTIILGLLTRVQEGERRKLSYISTVCWAVCWALFINIRSYPFMKIYIRNLSCISVPGFSWVLASFISWTLWNFIGECVSLSNNFSVYWAFIMF